MKLSDLNGLVKAYREAMPFLAIGFQMAAIVIIMFLLGKYADEKLGTYPWLMLFGILFGISAGFYHFFKQINEFSRKSKKDTHNENQ